MKILVYGGTFNPIHLAHLNNLRLAHALLDFDKIIIVPNKNGHFKDSEELADVENRLKMLHLALRKLGDIVDSIEISQVELQSEQLLYSNDVIDLLQKEHPKAQYYFLIGSDQAQQLNKWHKIAELKKKVRFVVTKRNQNYQSSEFIVIDNDLMPYSSTAIRHYYASSGIATVDKFIRENGLYLPVLLRSYLSDSRIIHSENVAALAWQKALVFGINQKKAYIAGMLHDITKEMPLIQQYKWIKQDSEQFEINDATIHALSGYYFTKEKLLICDEAILEAIKYHTTGFYQMSPLTKLIYICDMLSAERKFADIERLRYLLNHDLDECFKECFFASFAYLEKNGIIISTELKKLKEMIERNEV